tara:strand:- start:25 stop:738 length:714 start_codon:yes stop_codon:yes gene_type:complete
MQSRIFLVFVALLVGAPLALAQKETPFGKPVDQLSPDEILRLVRLSYTLHDHDFDARLRKEFEIIPFKLSLKPNYIRFRFDDPAQAVHLDTSGEQLILREVVEGSNAPVALARYGEFIRGTDLTYEDLAMRFLYWPNPKVIDKMELVKARPTWKLKLDNPDQRGPYGHVIVWIDKASGGLIKMEGYDRAEKPGLLKDFDVTHGKKMQDVWIADVIRVRSYLNGDKQGTTWLEIQELK